MCSPSPPPPPDYLGAAQAQGAANIEAALAQGHINNPNVVNPYGTQTVTWNGNDPTITQTLSPEQQSLYNQQVGNQGALGNLAARGIETAAGVIGAPLNLSGLPAAGTAFGGAGGPSVLNLSSLPGRPQTYRQGDLPSMPQGSEAIRSRVIDAMMGRANEEFSRREDSVNSDLVARGIRPGTEAYSREMQRIDQARNDARNQAEMAAGDEVARAYGMDLSSRQQGFNEGITGSNLAFNQGMGLRGQAAGEQQQQFTQGGQAAELFQRQQGQTFQQQQELRRQAITEALAQRQIPLNEITALMSGSQVSNPFSMPGYAQNANVAPAPIFGATQAAGNYATDAYNARAGGANSFMNGLFGLGASAMPFLF